MQYTDGVVSVPVVLVMLVPQVQVVAETAEIPQLLLDAQVPRVQVVERTVRIPQLPFVEKIAVIPKIRTAPGTQTSVRSNGEFDAGHDEKSVQDALAVGVVSEAGQRQPHCSSKQPTQTAQERERESEGRVIRERREE